MNTAQAAWSMLARSRRPSAPPELAQLYGCRPPRWRWCVIGKLSKGDVFEVARLAGIMAAKRTSDLIPLCHPLPIDSVTVNFSFPDDTSIRVETAAACSGKTGIEMEALVAASAAALTIYDMCKAAQRDIVIEQLQLEEKSGGRSGHWQHSSV